MDGIGGKPAWAWIFSKWTFLSSCESTSDHSISNWRTSYSCCRCLVFLDCSGFPGHSQVFDRGGTNCGNSTVARWWPIQCCRRRATVEVYFSESPGLEDVGWKCVATYWSIRRRQIWSSIHKVICYCGCDMPLYAFALFLPSIINEVSLNHQSLLDQISNRLFY